MYCLVLFILFCRLIYAIIFHENVAFHKINEIAFTQSKCLSKFVIETQPYDNLLKRLSEDLSKNEIAANSMEKFYDYTSKQDYHKIIKGVNDEINTF